MNGVRSGKTASGTPLQLFNCTYTNCGATFTRQWRLKEHETVHTGAVRELSCNKLRMFKFLQFTTVLTIAKCSHNTPKLWNLIPNVHSACVSARLLTVVVVSQGNITSAATCFSTEGWSCSSKSQLIFTAVHLDHNLNLTSLCRCESAGCTQSFVNGDKLKRHVRYDHGDKNTYFKVCVNTRMCPRDGAKTLHWNILLEAIALDAE